MEIGFIGAGSMGAAMIPNLVRAGHRVKVWNRNPDAAEAIEGVELLATPSAAFANDAVVTMLSDDAAVRDVVFASNALQAARKDCVHVMMCTISLALVEELELAHRAAGIEYVAAPVMGIPAVAAKAQLNILAAGSKSAVQAVQPIFDVLGQKTWYLGEDPKHANIAKIAGNMMITLAIEAIGEAAALTESYGLKAADFLNVITNTALSSPSYQRYGSNLSNSSFEPGFKLTLGLKDIELAFAAAQAKDTPLPSAQVVRQHMLKAIESGLGAKDWSVFATVVGGRPALS